MKNYTKWKLDRAVVAFYDIHQENGACQFIQPQSLYWASTQSSRQSITW